MPVNLPDNPFLSLFSSADEMQKIQQRSPRPWEMVGDKLEGAVKVRFFWVEILTSHLKLCDLGQVTYLSELSFYTCKWGIMIVLSLWARRIFSDLRQL